MSGGYRKYLRNVIPRMGAHPEVEALLCISPESLYVQDSFEPLPNIEFMDFKPYGFFHHNSDPKLTQYLEKFSPDVIFVPVERHFRFDEVPIVTMIQNMEPFVGINKNPILERIISWARAKEARRSSLKSDRIVAVSKFVKEHIIQKWNITPEKIGLIYYGLDLLENKDIQRPDIIPKGWDGRFLFTAGSIRPARGLEDMFHALKYLVDSSSDIPVLVIAGETTSRMRKYRKRLEDWIRAYNLSSKVCWAGSLNEQEMSWCYRNCKAFVLTSRVESFGMIAGEAMSQGCICIAADNPCLPEIFGDVASYYPPRMWEALAEVIQAVLLWDDNQRKVASKRAKNRAKKFSWDVCAERTIAQLAKAARR